MFGIGGWKQVGATFDMKRQAAIRGLGTHSINVRLNDRPELVCVTLRGKQYCME